MAERPASQPSGSPAPQSLSPSDPQPVRAASARRSSTGAIAGLASLTSRSYWQAVISFADTRMEQKFRANLEQTSVKRIAKYKWFLVVGLVGVVLSELVLKPAEACGVAFPFLGIIQAAAVACTITCIGSGVTSSTGALRNLPIHVMVRILMWELVGLAAVYGYRQCNPLPTALLSGFALVLSSVSSARLLELAAGATLIALAHFVPAATGGLEAEEIMHVVALWLLAILFLTRHQAHLRRCWFLTFSSESLTSGIEARMSWPMEHFGVSDVALNNDMNAIGPVQFPFDSTPTMESGSGPPSDSFGDEETKGSSDDNYFVDSALRNLIPQLEAEKDMMKTKMTDIVRDFGYPSDEKPNYMACDRAIGELTLGTLYEGIRTDTGELGSVLKVHSSLMQHSELVVQELWSICAFSHPNLLQFQHVSTFHDSVMALMEFCDGSSLGTVLNTYGKLDQPLAQRYGSDILKACSYLHRHGMVHSELSADACYVTAQGGVKLVFLGRMVWAADTDCGQQNVRRRAEYLAPETLRHHFFGRQMDIWGLGVLTLEMLTLQTLLNPSIVDDFEALLTISAISETPQLPDTLSLLARSFISDCLTINPSLRPTAMKLENHLFLDPYAISTAPPTLPPMPSKAPGLPFPSQDSGVFDELKMFIIYCFDNIRSLEEKFKDADVENDFQEHSKLHFIERISPFLLPYLFGFWTIQLSSFYMGPRTLASKLMLIANTYWASQLLVMHMMAGVSTAWPFNYNRRLFHLFLLISCIEVARQEAKVFVPYFLNFALVSLGSHTQATDYPPAALPLLFANPPTRAETNVLPV